MRARALMMLAAAGLLAVAGLPLLSSPAGATDVTSESELRAAFGDAAETEVVLLADVDLTCAGGGELSRSSTTDLTLVGNDHTITQTCAGARVINQVDVGEVRYEDVTITGGEAVGNGGGGIRGSGEVTLVRSTVTDNQAPSTGGGGVNADLVTLVDSTVSNNQADDFGGGINATDILMHNSTVSGNTSAGRAGGLGAASVVMTNSTVSGNTAESEPGGGGIFVFNATLVYSTVVGNDAPNRANLYAETGLTSFGSVVAEPGGGGANCGVGGTTSNGYNFSDDASCLFVQGTDQESAGSPELGALADNGGPTSTHLPLAGSPLLDAVPSASCEDDGAAGVTTDQRGVARPQFGGCDIGSVEVAEDPPSPPTSPTTPVTPGTGPGASPVAQAVARTPSFTG